jgi:hypothetical protein
MGVRALLSLLLLVFLGCAVLAAVQSQWGIFVLLLPGIAGAGWSVVKSFRTVS